MDILSIKTIGKIHTLLANVSFKFDTNNGHLTSLDIMC